MSITSQIASRIWKRKSELGTLSAVHHDFIRWGGDCSYETFRQFANESTLGSGELVNQLDKYLNEKESE